MSMLRSVRFTIAVLLAPPQHRHALGDAYNGSSLLKQLHHYSSIDRRNNMLAFLIVSLIQQMSNFMKFIYFSFQRDLCPILDGGFILNAMRHCPPYAMHTSPCRETSFLSLFSLPCTLRCFHPRPHGFKCRIIRFVHDCPLLALFAASATASSIFLS